jgi:hypothetical protein
MIIYHYHYTLHPYNVLSRRRRTSFSDSGIPQKFRTQRGAKNEYKPVTTHAKKAYGVDTRIIVVRKKKSGNKGCGLNEQR